MASGENGNRHDILQNGDKPDVLGLKSLYADFASQCQPFASRAQKNARIRFCEWEGQSPDGRKHGSLRKPAYPWNGASDTRTYTADAIINENVALRLNALSLGAVKAVPVGFSDPENAAVARELIKWLTSPAKMPELRSELSMLANFAEEQGAAVLGFYWERKTETRVKIASAQEAAELSQNAAQWLALSEYPVLDNGEIAAIAQIEQAKMRAAEELSATLSISDKDAEKLLDQCRERGAGKYPSVEIVSDRPRVRAFRIGADILVPSDIDDLQNAPAIFTVEFMRPHELREKSKSEGWDAKWVEKIVECCVNGLPAEENSPRVAAYDKVSADASYSDTVKIATAYYRARDSRGDVRLCYAIFAPDYDESGVAKAGRLEYEPSRLPFEAFRRETVSRKILDSRGSPEILEGWQRDVKTQRDSRNDKPTTKTLKRRLMPLEDEQTYAGLKELAKETPDQNVSRWAVAPEKLSEESRKNILAAAEAEKNSDLIPLLKFDKKYLEQLEFARDLLYKDARKFQKDGTDWRNTWIGELARGFGSMTLNPANAAANAYVRDAAGEIKVDGVVMRAAKNPDEVRESYRQWLEDERAAAADARQLELLQERNIEGGDEEAVFAESAGEDWKENAPTEAESRENSSNLTEYQRLQVRTPNFKQWFGDWDRYTYVYDAMKFLKKTEAVAKLTGKEFQKDGVRLTDKVPAYFKSIGGIAHREELGDIILDLDSVKDSIGHGIGKLKAAAFMAVKDVIEKGYIFNRSTNWKNRGYDSAVIVAPILIDNDYYICEVVVRKNKKRDAFYLHEVEIRETLEDMFKTTTKGAISQASHLILGKHISEVNKKNVSKVVDENGEPLVVFHGTDNVNPDYSHFVEFKHSDPRVKKYRHFFSSNRDVAGSMGSYIYECFLDIKNPLVIDAGGNEFAAIKDHTGGIVKFSDLTDSQKRELCKAFDFTPEELEMSYSPSDKIDLVQAGVIRREERSTNEWADYAQEKGFDGVIIRNVRDGGDYGAMQTPADVFVVFDSTQIKSATGNIGTYSRSNRNIFKDKDGSPKKKERHYQDTSDNPLPPDISGARPVRFNPKRLDDSPHSPGYDADAADEAVADFLKNIAKSPLSRSAADVRVLREKLAKTTEKLDPRMLDLPELLSFAQNIANVNFSVVKKFRGDWLGVYWPGSKRIQIRADLFRALGDLQRYDLAVGAAEKTLKDAGYAEGAVGEMTNKQKLDAIAANGLDGKYLAAFQASLRKDLREAKKSGTPVAAIGVAAHEIMHAIDDVRADGSRIFDGGGTLGHIVGKVLPSAIRSLNVLGGAELSPAMREHFRREARFAAGIRNLPKAYAAAASLWKGRATAEALDALERQMVVSRRNYWTGEGADIDEVKRLISEFGINDAREYSTRAERLSKLWGAYTAIGQIFERAAKINMKMYVDERLGSLKLSEAQKQQFVREQGGSPDFNERAIRWLHGLIEFFTGSLFINARKQGFASEITGARQFAENTGKSRKRAYAEWTFHTLLWSSPGAFIRVCTALGAGGVLLRMCGCSEEELPDAEQMYWQIPEYDRLNKICIPLGRDGNGKTVYLRLPYGDFERYYGNLCTSFIEAFELEEEFIDGGVRWIKNIKRIGESELGGGHPITGTARNIAAIALGENPDDGIGRPIIDETVYKAGDVAGIAADTARYAYNNTMGSIVGRIKPPLKAGEPEPAFLEKVLSMPGISAALGRWIAVSDKGLDQLARDAARKEEKTSAQRTLQRRELAEKAAAGTISDADFEPLAGGFTRGDKQALRAQLKKIEARKNGKMDSILINYPARAQQEAIRRQLNRIGAGHEEN